jgi:alpha-beta hydrolase superfamily lysophospholipase
MALNIIEADETAFLIIDYPGHGDNPGHPSTKTKVDQVMSALRHLHDLMYTAHGVIHETKLSLFAHDAGCTIALCVARHILGLDRIVLVHS